MSQFVPQGFGAERDPPDHRDYAFDHEVVRDMLRALKSKRRGESLPDQVDGREYLPRAENQGDFPTCTAHACIALMQYHERRAHGRLLRPSRLFVDAVSRRLAGRSLSCGVSPREVLAGIRRFGLPPETHWPYDMAHHSLEPDAFLYGFNEDTVAMRYFRFDSRGRDSREVLARIKRFLAAGFGLVLSFLVPSSLDQQGEVPFPTQYDAIQGHQTVLALGYDDRRRIRSDKGALLIRGSWGEPWGENGYGWLPYAYVAEGLATDCWSAIRHDWIASSEFQRP